MTSEALIRELATKPEFRILSELGREIADKVRTANLRKVVYKEESEPDIKEGMEKFRKELAELGITTVEGLSVGELSDDDLYQKAVFPIDTYFLREIPRD